MTERRFIEEHFPVEKVSEESIRDKSVRHGHISTMHLWWARRPLAASRATIYASLIPAPKNKKEVETLKQEIAELSRWSNPIRSELVDRARKRIMDYNKTPPRVLDPFAGGGSIPLEALRLGCETYASDYNPVASLIVKAAIEYPFLGGMQNHGHKQHEDSPLIICVKKWSQWVLEEAKKDLAAFFPTEKEGEPVGYMWSRCIPCQNPRCGATIPLMMQFWLVRTRNKKIVLLPSVQNKKISFKIAEYGKDEIPQDFDPQRGTISRGKASCLICGHRMDGDRVKALFTNNENTENMNVVIINNKERSGKTYKIATKNHLDVFVKARQTLKKKQRRIQQKYGVDLIPNESTPEGKGSGAERAFSIRLYNMNTWGDLFNDRQKLVQLTFVEKILEAAKMIEKENSPKYVQTLPYLGIIFDRLVAKNVNLARYNVARENVEQIFSRLALPMIWDYTEINPFTSIGWPNMEKWVLGVLEHLSIIDAKPAVVKCTSATALPFSNEFFDAVITDPPYYDNIPYSHLSDFFYVWLKRIMGSRFSDMFSTPLTPKSDEIVTYSNGPGGIEAGKKFFQETLAKSFQEIHRVLKPNGIAVIVYAHKSIDGWETLIESLLQAGLVVTAAWPIHTEMKSRLRSNKSAALLSSIYMVCRKWKRKPVGFYQDIRRDLKQYLDKKLDQLWNEKIAGADFFIASIGSAIEVYGKYDKVIDNQDKDVPILKLLEDTRTMVTNYAIDKVIRGEFAGKISPLTRFYILWRWAHGDAKAPFDDALKLAHSVGIDLTQELDKGFIRKDKEYVHMAGPDERESENLKDSGELIDILHHALILWRNQMTEESEKFLTSKGYKHSEVLKRVAQAISESLSDSASKEKIWIDGMFTGSLGVSHDPDQTKIF